VDTIILRGPKKLEKTGRRVNPEELILQTYYNPMRKYNLGQTREK
jgi:hypothetical protein